MWGAGRLGNHRILDGAHTLKQFGALLNGEALEQVLGFAVRSLAEFGEHCLALPGDLQKGLTAIFSRMLCG
jgi:hypothetical protein